MQHLAKSKTDDSIMSTSFLWFRPVERAVTLAVQTLAVVSVFVMITSLILGVFFRYVMQDSLFWSDEVAMLCFSWLIFLTAALMVRENGHVRIELIESFMPEKLYWLLDQIVWIVIALVGVYMAWTGFQFLSLTMGQTSPAIRYPLWARDGSLPVGGVLITLYALLNINSKPVTQADQPIQQEVGLKS